MKITQMKAEQNYISRFVKMLLMIEKGLNLLRCTVHSTFQIFNKQKYLNMGLQVKSILMTK